MRAPLKLAKKDLGEKDLAERDSALVSLALPKVQQIFLGLSLFPLGKFGCYQRLSKSQNITGSLFLV